VFDALISLLPIESETYRRRRNVAESGRMYSSFDELVGRLRHFDCAETAKFDVLCCVMNCVVCAREYSFYLYHSITLVHTCHFQSLLVGSYSYALNWIVFRSGFIFVRRSPISCRRASLPMASATH
jgi:hypothetical protein